MRVRQVGVRGDVKTGTRFVPVLVFILNNGILAATFELILQLLEGIPIAGGSQFGLLGPGVGVHHLQLVRVQDVLKFFNGGIGQQSKGGDAIIIEQAGDFGANTFELLEVIRFSRGFRFRLRFGFRQWFRLRCWCSYYLNFRLGWWLWLG